GARAAVDRENRSDPCRMAPYAAGGAILGVCARAAGHDAGRERRGAAASAARAGAAASPGGVRPRARGKAAQRGRARAARRADRALPRRPHRSDPDGVDVSARDRRGRALGQEAGEREAEGRCARQGAQGAGLGSEREVARPVSRALEEHGREARPDAEARRRGPRPAEGRDGRDPAPAQAGTGRGEPEVQRAAEGDDGVGTDSKTGQTTEVIVIQPASPQVVYVPTYQPTVVYGAWPYP